VGQGGTFCRDNELERSGGGAGGSAKPARWTFAHRTGCRWGMAAKARTSAYGSGGDTSTGTSGEPPASDPLACGAAARTSIRWERVADDGQGLRPDRGGERSIAKLDWLPPLPCSGTRLSRRRAPVSRSECDAEARVGATPRVRRMGRRNREGGGRRRERGGGAGGHGRRRGGPSVRKPGFHYPCAPPRR